MYIRLKARIDVVHRVTDTVTGREVTPTDEHKEMAREAFAIAAGQRLRSALSVKWPSLPWEVFPDDDGAIIVRCPDDSAPGAVRAEIPALWASCCQDFNRKWQ